MVGPGPQLDPTIYDIGPPPWLHDRMIFFPLEINVHLTIWHLHALFGSQRRKKRRMICQPITSGYSVNRVALLALTCPWFFFSFPLFFSHLPLNSLPLLIKSPRNTKQYSLVCSVGAGNSVISELSLCAPRKNATSAALRISAPEAAVNLSRAFAGPSRL